jgi:hypothetical protein
MMQPAVEELRVAGRVSRKFVITSVSDGTSFWSYFADGSPIVIEGYAGWQVVNRPKAIGITEWQGRNPMAIEIPFMIDYWVSGLDAPGVACEAQVASLEKLCGVGKHFEQPPICTVDGNGVIPHDLTIDPGTRWVIEQVTWDRSMELRHWYTGRRLRCGGTIQIRQYVSVSPLLHKIKPHRGPKPRIYIVKRGDTHAKIAKKFYHDARKWHIIADANHMRDRRKLKVGQRLKIPRLKHH